MAGRPPFAEFDADSEDIESYLERLQECFTAYDIADDEDNCFRVLKDLAFPDAPNTKTFAQMATLLREHFKPARLKITERYRFPFCCSATRTVHRRFLRELRKLAGTRSFYLWLALTTCQAETLVKEFYLPRSCERSNCTGCGT